MASVTGLIFSKGLLFNISVSYFKNFTVNGTVCFPSFPGGII